MGGVSPAVNLRSTQSPCVHVQSCMLKESLFTRKDKTNYMDPIRHCLLDAILTATYRQWRHGTYLEKQRPKRAHVLVCTYVIINEGSLAWLDPSLVQVLHHLFTCSEACLIEH